MGHLSKNFDSIKIISFRIWQQSVKTVDCLGTDVPYSDFLFGIKKNLRSEKSWKHVLFEYNRASFGFFKMFPGCAFWSWDGHSFIDRRDPFWLRPLKVATSCPEETKR